MKKRLFSAFLVVFMVAALFSGCTKKTEQAANSNSNGKKGNQKYALLMSHMTNAFTMELSGAVKAQADKLGVSLTVFDGENNAAKQISQAESAITQGYSGIIIEAISVDGIKPAVEAAKKSQHTCCNSKSKNCTAGVSKLLCRCKPQRRWTA